MITIIETRTEEIDGTPIFRHANIMISNGTDAYLWGVGGLPLTGDLQAILNARETELFAAAAGQGEPVTLDWIEARRNTLLRATDWTQVPDAPLTATQKSLYDNYRLALQNITNRFNVPAQVIFPTAPTEAELLQAKSKQNRPAMANKSIIKDLPT